MRTMVLGVLLLAAFAVNVGCVIPIYSSSADIRARRTIKVVGKR